jgi:hypothetical protein
MFKDCFDQVVLISPTANLDDVQASFGVDPCGICDDLKLAPAFLAGIFEMQKKSIEEYGNADAPKICIIFDDIAGDTKFINSKEFVACFTKCRHFNLTTFCLTQAFKAIKKTVRLQANNIMWFESSESETMCLVENFTPPGYSKRRFLELITYAVGDDHGFLYINMKAPFSKRYRKDLGEIIEL